MAASPSPADGSSCAITATADEAAGIACALAPAAFSVASEEQQGAPRGARVDSLTLAWLRTYDFGDYFSHCCAHMVGDFALAMGDQEAAFSDGYLAKLRQCWVALDKRRTGWLPLRELPALCAALASAPEPVALSWVLTAGEAAAWGAADGAARISFRRVHAGAALPSRPSLAALMLCASALDIGNPPRCMPVGVPRMRINA